MNRCPVLGSLIAILAGMSLTACGRASISRAEAAELSAEFEAGANEATDPTTEQVLRDHANSFREISGGNEIRQAGQRTTPSTPAF